jgi:hypothetical protein
MNYSEFTEQVRIATITNNINLTINMQDVKFAYTAYTNLNIPFREAFELMLDKKSKNYTRVRAGS